MNALLFRAGVFAFLACAIGPVLAHDAGDFYLSSELEINFSSGFDFFGNRNAQGGLCFPFINPDPSSRQAAGCPTMGNGMKSDFDGGQGILAGVGVGYCMGGPADRLLSRLRIEMEYVFRKSVYKQPALVVGRTGVARDKLSCEIFFAQERVGSLTSHSLFSNLYVDFVNDSRSTSYIGVGAGFGVTDLDSGRIWARNHDWRQINTGSDLPNAEEMRRNLAGGASSFQGANRDTMFGYQLPFGVDVALTETASMGLKGPWADFGTMRYDGTFDLALSNPLPDDYHNSREVDGVSLFAVSANLKNRF